MNAKLNPLNEKFSVEKAVEIQHRQVEEWRPKLVKDLFESLRQWVIQQNNQLPKDACGYDVVRGDRITEWVLNARRKPGTAWQWEVN